MTRKTILLIALCLSLSQTILAQAVLAQPNLSQSTQGDDSTDATILDRIRLESEETTGTIFRGPDLVEVKAPLLKALIQTQVPLSPYQLDADSARSISLKDVAQAALDGNLSIKISNADREMGRWRFWSSMGQFLPEVINGVSYQGIRGNYASPFGQIAPANSPYLVIPNSLNLYLFKGGTILFGALRASHDYKALNWSLKGTTNDVLFDVSKLYYQLVLNNVLLQIRIKGVELGESLLARNNILFENGANTKLDVLQAKTQL